MRPYRYLHCTRSGQSRSVKMEEEVASGGDNIVTEFNTYEDFLDSQITSLDLYYLEVISVLQISKKLMS